MNLRRLIFSLVVFLASLASVWANPFLPQKDSKPKDKKEDTKPASKSDAKAAEKDPDAPAPLLKGNIGLKSSRRTNDSATAGFNGLDPQGKVANEVLQASATEDDRAKALGLTNYAPKPEELASFVKEGNLNTAPAKLPGKK
jgi:hypothetical protein